MTLKDRIIEVLNRIISTVEEVDDEDVLEYWASDIDCMLDEMASNDFFGTEGQRDPRGDGREGEWSVMEEISDTY